MMYLERKGAASGREMFYGYGREPGFMWCQEMEAAITGEWILDSCIQEGL